MGAGKGPEQVPEARGNTDPSNTKDRHKVVLGDETQLGIMLVAGEMPIVPCHSDTKSSVGYPVAVQGTVHSAEMHWKHLAPAKH